MFKQNNNKKTHLLFGWVLVLGVTFIVSGFNHQKHPYFVGVTEVTINSKNKSLGLAVKVFTDDLQNVLYKNEHIPIQLSDASALNKKNVGDYLLSHFKIKLGNQQILLNFLGYEIVDEAIWMYAEPIKPIGSSIQKRSIVVCNELLYSEIPQQTHLIHCIRNGLRKSNKIINPTSCSQFEY